MDNKDIRNYLFIIDIATIVTTSFFLFKFESSYWLSKGSAVNQTAGFGDIFHDWALVLFIALPLFTITQIGLSALVSKKQPLFVLALKLVAFSAALVFINWNKIIAEVSLKQNWKACMLVLFGTTLYALYMYSVKKGIDTKFSNINKWIIPATAVAIVLTITIIY